MSFHKPKKSTIDIGLLYNERLIEIFIREQEEYSCFENSMVALDNDYQYYIDEAHQVLDGYKCFSIDNPFVFHSKDW